jgi:hypothetical protein
MSRKRTTTLAGLLALTGLLAPACIQTSGSAWQFRSAPTPEGWPDVTPVERVELRSYPVVRAALVDQADLERGDDDSMFMTLFRHIDRNEIAMTAPVEMRYEDTAAGPRMTSMAFLYRTPELGGVGEEGAVRVDDLPSQTYASTGLRGGYTIANYREGLARLQAWLAENAEVWRAAGPPRYLGYNSPFVLPFLRYGEVQIPVERL